MVRLKVNNLNAESFGITDFNSNMVRLKAAEYNDKIRELRFQFQYGSIKSVGKPNCTNYSTEFQFQYGSIKRNPSPRSGKSLPLFQFQYGSIKRLFSE